MFIYTFQCNHAITKLYLFAIELKLRNNFSASAQKYAVALSAAGLAQCH